MNLAQNPDLVERLAAAYALGTLRGGARRRFESLARERPALRVQALLWQERFMSMTELQRSQSPSPNVWKRIENLLEAERAPARAAVPTPDPLTGLLRRARNLWRGTAFAAGVAAVAAVVVAVGMRDELAKLQGQPQVSYVAVLTDDKSAPAMLVTFDPSRSTLTLKRVGSYQEGPDKSLQLWAVAPGSAPRSLGVLGEQPVLKLAAAEQNVTQSPVMAISLEPKGGVPGDRGPTGPVLWKGAVLQAPL